MDRALHLIKGIDPFALILERQDGYGVIVMDENANLEAAERVLTENQFHLSKVLPRKGQNDSSNATE